jgi:hypothetical protein
MTTARGVGSRTVLGIALLAACDSSSSGPAGGQVAGPPDDHCDVGGVLTPTMVGACLPPGADEPDGGVASSPDYGETLFNSVGYDDECKYRVAFTSTAVRKNEDVTFAVTVTALDPVAAAEGADVEAEVFLNDTHPAPNTNATTTEDTTGSGIYKIGPIRFDAPGRWTVRFHMYDRCADAPDSPHGHAAFFIDVP